METWYHVTSYAKEPYTCYGYAVSNGIVVKANDKVSWMIGMKKEDVDKFFENRPASVTEIKVSVDDQVVHCEGNS